jgi:hypothetical protein
VEVILRSSIDGRSDLHSHVISPILDVSNSSTPEGSDRFGKRRFFNNSFDLKVLLKQPLKAMKVSVAKYKHILGTVSDPDWVSTLAPTAQEYVA